MHVKAFLFTVPSVRFSVGFTTKLVVALFTYKENFKKIFYINSIICQCIIKKKKLFEF